VTKPEYVGEQLTLHTKFFIAMFSVKVFFLAIERDSSKSQS